MQPDSSMSDTFARFMRFVEMGQVPGDCWIWTGNRPDGRYGHFTEGGTHVAAHRWIYELLHGPIPNGLIVRHACDNEGCVNPQHLLCGTLSDNARDKVFRGRGADRRGEKHPMVKVTSAQVIRIRQLAEMRRLYADIADEIGISRQHVGKIVRRETWKHI